MSDEVLIVTLMIGKSNVVLIVRKCVCVCVCGVARYTVECPLQCPGAYRRMCSFECTRFRTKLVNYVAKFVTSHFERHGNLIGDTGVTGHCHRGGHHVPNFVGNDFEILVHHEGQRKFVRTGV